MKLIFLDTETTGLNEEDRLCQVAYKLNDEEMREELFKPPLPIKLESMAIHHFTEKMVADKPAFKDSEMYNELSKLFAEDDSVLIAHNVAFDAKMLAKEGLYPKNIICTRKVAEHLDEDAKISSYKLQYLRYLLDLDVGDVQAHSAEGDVEVLKALYDRLSAKCDYEKMIEISKKPILIKRFPFGKHKGKLLEDVARDDGSYLSWLYDQKRNDKDADNNEDWIYTLEHYLNI